MHRDFEVTIRHDMGGGGGHERFVNVRNGGYGGYPSTPPSGFRNSPLQPPPPGFDNTPPQPPPPPGFQNTPPLPPGPGLNHTPQPSKDDNADVSVSEHSEEAMRTLWVGGISEKSEEDVLYELFLNAGPIERISHPSDRETKKKKNFAFVVYRHPESIKYAYELLNGVELYGQRLRLQHKETGLGINIGRINPAMYNRDPRGDGGGGRNHSRSYSTSSLPHREEPSRGFPPPPHEMMMNSPMMNSPMMNSPMMNHQMNPMFMNGQMNGGYDSPRDYGWDQSRDRGRDHSRGRGGFEPPPPGAGFDRGYPRNGFDANPLDRMDSRRDHQDGRRSDRRDRDGHDDRGGSGRDRSREFRDRSHHRDHDGARQHRR